MNVKIQMFVLTEGSVEIFLAVFNAFVRKAQHLMKPQKYVRMKMNARVREIFYYFIINKALKIS